MSFREQAIKAYQQEQAARLALEEAEVAKRKAGAEEQARSAFAAVFGVQPDSVDGSMVIIDGLKLEHVNHRVFRLYGTCSQCGQEFPSRNCVHDLADLGYSLTEFEPQWHECHPPKAEGAEEAPQPPTFGERAQAVLSDLLELMYEADNGDSKF